MLSLLRKVISPLNPLKGTFCKLLIFKNSPFKGGGGFDSKKMKFRIFGVDSYVKVTF